MQCTYIILLLQGEYYNNGFFFLNAAPAKFIFMGASISAFVAFSNDLIFLTASNSENNG